jgi:predicted nucleic acid-binding Zn ribbon protein
VEVVQKFTDDPLSVCDACGGRLRKVFFPAGIVFKGSGFYRTDSRNGSSSPSVAAKDKQASESSSTSSSDSKPAEGKTADKPAAKSESASSQSKSSSSEKAA